MYTFDMNNDPNIRRIGYDWNHPSMRGVEAYNASAQVYEILDPTKTLDEQIATQEAISKQQLEALLTLVPTVAENLKRTEELFVPGLSADDPDVRCLVIRPDEPAKKKLPCIVYCYGGGMVMGCPENHLDELFSYANELGCVVIAPQYRLLPKWTYPAAVDDLEAATNYVIAHADELGVNLDRTIIMGQSAGGYVAACTAQRMKMRGGWQFAGQYLMYPLVDDTFGFPSSDIFFGEVWHARDDQTIFDRMFTPGYVRAAVPEDGVPLHCKNYKGLPPTVIVTGDLDYGHDPIIKYAQGIMDASIYCDLHIFGGCFHGFIQMAPGTDISNRALVEVLGGLRDLLTGECVRK